MSTQWHSSPILVRADGSFIITQEGLPCHVPDNAEFAALHKEVAAFAAANPAFVTSEVVPEPTQKEIIDRFKRLIQLRLDTFAYSDGTKYDNILSACSYATSTNPVFGVEGQYCVEARDETWRVANAILNTALTSGTVPGWEAVEAQLPPLQWPDTSGL